MPIIPMFSQPLESYLKRSNIPGSRKILLKLGFVLNNSLFFFENLTPALQSVFVIQAPVLRGSALTESGGIASGMYKNINLANMIRSSCEDKCIQILSCLWCRCIYQLPTYTNPQAIVFSLQLMPVLTRYRTYAAFTWPSKFNIQH